MKFKQIFESVDKPYKGFKVGDEVRVKKDIKCQYYDYPKVGDENFIMKKGEIGIIHSIPPKVRIVEKGSGSMFFNLYKKDELNKYNYPGRLYSIMNYRDIEKI